MAGGLSDDMFGLAMTVLHTIDSLLVWTTTALPLAFMCWAVRAQIRAGRDDAQAQEHKVSTDEAQTPLAEDIACVAIAFFHVLTLPIFGVVSGVGHSVWAAAFAIVFAEFCLLVIGSVVGWSIWLACNWGTVLGTGQVKWTRSSGDAGLGPV